MSLALVRPSVVFRVPCSANHSVFIEIINLIQKQISVGWGLVNSESVLGGGLVNNSIGKNVHGFRPI